MQDEVIISLKTSTPRGWFGLVTLGVLGVLLIYLGVTLNADLLGRVFVIVLGGFTLYGVSQMYRALQTTLELTRDELREANGTVIAKIADVQSLDRGMFAFKPSNGFILRLTSAPGFYWRPGLCWRVGKRVGIGGVTHAPQTKAMAEVITSLLQKTDTQA